MDYIETVEVPVGDLIHFPGNAREHADEQLQASVRRLGQFRSVVVRLMPDKSYVILAGNGTVDALREVGYQYARVEVIECDDDEAGRINVADNRLSDIATDNSGLLAEQLLKFDGDYAGLGFTDDEANRIIALASGDGMPDPGDAPVDDDTGHRWGLIVECGTEAEQVRLLGELSGQGLNVRSIMS